MSGAVATIGLSVAATVIGFVSVVLASNIYEANPPICYACRWAVTVWSGTLTIGLFVLAYQVNS